MYLHINNQLDLKFSENMLKTLASGIATNLVAYIASSIAITTTLTFLPGLGSISASAIAGGVAYALTIVSGEIYLSILTKIFKSGININSISNDEIKEMADDIIDNSYIKSAIKKAKKSYKPKD